MTSFYADTSEFQPVYNTEYPYPVAMFRFHSGFRLDNNAAANWAYHKTAIASGRTRLVYAYAVFIPGQLSAVLAGLKQLFGPKCPTDRLVIVIDMESGTQFAGPGNHSSEANIWAGGFQAWGAQVDPYANQPDYAECWPQLAPSLTRRHISDYAAIAPFGAYSWQYYGGVPNPSPPGAPTSCPPFGAAVDMNVIYRSIDQIELDYGITKPPPPDPPIPGEDDMSQNIYEVATGGAAAGQYWCREQPSGNYFAIQTGNDITALELGGAVNCTGKPISQGLHDEFVAASPNKGSGNLTVGEPS